MATITYRFPVLITGVLMDRQSLVPISKMVPEAKPGGEAFEPAPLVDPVAGTNRILCYT